MKKYKCGNCEVESNIISLGELAYGCLDCGAKNFLQLNEETGKYEDRPINNGEQKLANYLR